MTSNVELPNNSTSANVEARGPGYICKCVFGSPRPYVVVFRADLHDRGCPVRRKIVDPSYGFDTIIQGTRD